MIRRLFLTALLLASVGARGATYYADPNGGGAASCVDNSTNVCTIARAITVASSGDTVLANCGTYDLGSGHVSLNKNITFSPATTGCATLTSTDATAVVVISGQNDANTLTLGSFVIVPTSTSPRSISVSNLVGYDATIVVSGTTIYSGTSGGVNDASLRGTSKYLNVIATGTLGTGNWIGVTNQASAAAKKVLVQGCSGTLSASNNGSKGVSITRSTTTPQGMWAQIDGCNLSITVPSSAGANIGVVGLEISNVTAGSNLSSVTEPPIIKNSTITLDTRGATGSDSTGIQIIGTDSGATAQLGQIYNNTVTLNTPAGFGIACGDGTTQSYTDDCQIYTNTVTNTNTAGTPHGIRIGRHNRGLVRSNVVNGGAVGIIAGINDGALISGNVIIGAYYAPLFAKGSGGSVAPTFTNNTVIMDDSLYGGKSGNYGCLAAAISGATNNTATNFYNNNCYVAKGTTWKYVVVDASQAATFANNNYYAIPSLTNPWSYQGAAQTSLSGWQGAQEASATGVDPKFVASSPQSATDVKLTAASSLRRSGKYLNIGRVPDYGNRAFHNPPTVGAWEFTSGDPISTRTAR